jgi:calcineurin-like phosphoesterase family protein
VLALSLPQLPLLHRQVLQHSVLAALRELRKGPGPQTDGPVSVQPPKQSVSTSPFRRRLVSILSLVAAVLPMTNVGAASADPAIVAAGDIGCPGAPCVSQRQTARLIGRIAPAAVLTLGDNQYSDGSLRDYRASYDPTWGRFKARTYPTPGNHDYDTLGADGYFDYFGARAHRASNGMYSVNIGRWHVVSINSGRGIISARQLGWVRRNLRRDRHRCELAFWHHPRWSSGTVHGSARSMDALWRVLWRHGVDVVLNGHEHNYERFKLMNPAGAWAPRAGIRQFVVGTGGYGLYALGPPIRGSQKRIDNRFGLLRMELHALSYQWRFVTANRVVLDRGRHACHA